MIRVPNAVTSADIAAIFRVQEAYRDVYPEPLPKQPYWVTTYLSAAARGPVDAPNGLFRAVEPELFSRLCELRRLVDPRSANAT